MAFVAISGVRLGSVNWQYTRGPLGLTISIVLLLESDASPLPLIATLSAGLLFAVIRERCLDSGVVVLVSPLLYLLAPFTVTADLLGFRDNWLRSAAAQAPAVPSPVTASGACARPHAIDDADRIHPPKARPNRPLGKAQGQATRLRPGPAELAMTRARAGRRKAISTK